MERLALGRLLGRIVMAALPLGASLHAGCGPCPDEAVNTYVDVPDGGIDAMTGVLLPEPECAIACGWQSANGDAGANGPTLDSRQPHQCRLAEDPATRTTRVFCQYFLVASCIGGRRPEGLVAAGGPSAASATGRHFARMAHLEAASIPAFERLHDELAAHGAPRALRLLARAARADEVRHARVAKALARRFGAEPPAVELQAAGPRSLEAMAIENAIEGCVGETWGALVASYQGLAAGGAIGRAMRAVAVDETRHAALGWAVDRFARARLDAAARGRVLAARRAAAAALAKEAARPVDDELVRDVGLPPPPAARALVDGAMRALWS